MPCGWSLAVWRVGWAILPKVLQVLLSSDLIYLLGHHHPKSSGQLEPLPVRSRARSGGQRQGQCVLVAIRKASGKLTWLLPTSPKDKDQPRKGGLGLELLPRVDRREVGLWLCGEGTQSPLCLQPTYLPTAATIYSVQLIYRVMAAHEASCTGTNYALGSRVAGKNKNLGITDDLGDPSFPALAPSVCLGTSFPPGPLSAHSRGPASTGACDLEGPSLCVH